MQIIYKKNEFIVIAFDRSKSTISAFVLIRSLIVWICLRLSFVQLRLLRLSGISLSDRLILMILFGKAILVRFLSKLRFNSRANFID
jgi:small neutral amino acid transporter SnatA (MarC family)